MASGAVVSSSISSTAARRLHNQSQLSNHSISIGESLNFTDSFSLSSSTITPLITITYFNISLSQENQQLILNSYSSCRRLIEHMKQIVGIQQDETIDLIDNEGKLKELGTHFDDYASQFLTARSTYYVLKVEVDSTTGEKRYIPNFNIDQLDQKLNTILTNALNTLNRSASKPKRPTGTLRQNVVSQSLFNTTQSKTKRTSNKK
ncbi:unnamed protein product [Adineta steineri]|uniref:Uncharacterized protein n=1 Tax=Adineta steineri TaxID=433720 RepID=A0A814A3E7_9BILA|nr:unnamed protein product [Adineta steineri]CAF1047693.1 unnamed protein product [Adineta steineri]